MLENEQIMSMVEQREIKLSTEARQQRILQTLEHKGFVTVPEMASKCCVSEMTTRRDLDKLAEAGELERTHGGAISLRSGERVSLDLIEPRYESRMEVNAAEKRAIAGCAAEMVGIGQTVALDVGSTCFNLAQHLCDRQINIFTSSLKIAAFLSEKKASAYVPPGQIYGSEPSIVGPQAVDHLANFRFDLAFIGVSGVTEFGFHDYSVEDTNIKRALVNNAQRAIILMDSSKFGRMSVAQISSFDPIEAIIIDASPPGWLVEICKNRDTNITLANPVKGE